MFLVLGAAHSKVLGHSPLEELKGRHCVGLKISVTGQGQMGLGGLEAAFWITQDFRIWASPRAVGRRKGGAGSSEQ